MKKLIVLLGLLLACGDDAGGPSDAGTCNPLEVQKGPTRLGTVVAAGSAPDGTLYVVTRDGKEPRVYVSEGDTLVRRRVLSSGFSIGSSDLVDDSVSFDDSQTSRLVIQSDNSYAVRMALVHDNTNTFYDTAAGKTELSVQPASAVQQKPVRDLPPSVLVLYAATTPDGQQLIVTRPENDATPQDYELFLGSKNELHEIMLTSAVDDTTTTRFEFMLNGLPGSLVIGNPRSSTESLLSHDGGQWSITLLATGSGLPSGWRFYCP